MAWSSSLPLPSLAKASPASPRSSHGRVSPFPVTCVCVCASGGRQARAARRPGREQECQRARRHVRGRATSGVDTRRSTASFLPCPELDAISAAISAHDISKPDDRALRLEFDEFDARACWRFAADGGDGGGLGAGGGAGVAVRLSRRVARAQRGAGRGRRRVRDEDCQFPATAGAAASAQPAREAAGGSGERGVEGGLRPGRHAPRRRRRAALQGPRRHGRVAERGDGPAHGVRGVR